MIRIERQELYNFLDLADKIHDVHTRSVHDEPEIFKMLFEDNEPKKGRGRLRGYFIRMDDMYVQYGMGHVVVDVEKAVIARILDFITVYDDFQEYEADRVRTLSRAKPEDQKGLYLN